MKRLVETRFIHYLVGSIDALLANAYVLELMWQEQFANGDMDYLLSDIFSLMVIAESKYLEILLILFEFDVNY